MRDRPSERNGGADRDPDCGGAIAGLRRGTALSLMLAVALGVWGVGMTEVGAHDGPEHAVEELTERIHAEGENAELLLDRAVELVLLGRMMEAERDLERAVRLDPESRDALRELARVQAWGGHPERGEANLDRALRLPGSEPVERGALLMARAEIRTRRGRLREALADCDAAIRLHRGNPEWYLRRSALQRQLGQDRRRLAGIEDGLRSTGAGVLIIERVEALIDAGRCEEALLRIGPELEASRVRAGWLLRRGRARLALGRTEEGRQDLEEARRELDARLSAGRPDAGLLADRALAEGLLGDREGAERNLDRALAEGGAAEVEVVRGILERASKGRTRTLIPKKSGPERQRGVEK